MRKNPYAIILLGFAAVILLGTAAFMLPIPHLVTNGGGLSFFDALFTATSATCVTGLSTVSIHSQLTPLGQGLVLVMMQIGGLGLMTLSTFFGLLLGILPKLQDRMLIKEALNQVEETHVSHLIRRIVLFTLIMELSGAVALYSRIPGDHWHERVFGSLFLSVSAFCNAGFTLFPDSLEGFRHDGLVVAVISTLIVAGGLGFWVVHSLYEHSVARFGRRSPPRPLRLHTRLVVVTTAVLITVGTVLFMVMEGGRSMVDVSGGQALEVAFFQSVTTRTAGFNTVDIGALSVSTLLWIMLFMFIGGSPGSTAGGIKTTTFAVMIASLRAVLTGRRRVEIMRCSLPEEVVRRAHAVFLASLLWVFTAVFLMTLGGVNHDQAGFVAVLFETVSAFGTVGLSMGATQALTPMGKLILSLTMYAGRVGPLSLILVLAQRPDRPRVTYPDQQVPIG